jgi:hypothetical protein
VGDRIGLGEKKMLAVSFTVLNRVNIGDVRPCGCPQGWWEVD